jgi:hypothetical protein
METEQQADATDADANAQSLGNEGDSSQQQETTDAAPPSEPDQSDRPQTSAPPLEAPENAGESAPDESTQ